MDIEAIAFDCYGTLLQIRCARRPYARLLDRLEAAGRPRRPDDRITLMSRPLDLASAAGVFGFDPAAVPINDLEQDLREEIASIEPFPEVQDTLARLRGRGLRLAVVSNLALPYGAPLRHLLPDLDAYVLSCEAGHLKPQPGIYAALCAALALAPERILVVGDSSEADFHGPRRCGLKALALDRGGEAIGPETIRSLDELPRWLDE